MSYNNFDFFGVKKKQKKTVPRPFFFLGKSNALAPSRPVPTTKYWGTPSPTMGFGKPLYKKESIKQKKLSKWGDADMDGSPNYFDCDPVDWLKDAKKIKRKSVAKKLLDSNEYKTYQEEAEKRLQERAKKQVESSEKGKIARERLQANIKARTKMFSLKSPEVADLEYSIEQKLKKGKYPKQKELQKYAKVQKGKWITTETVIEERKGKVREYLRDKYGNKIKNPKTGKALYVETEITAPQYKEVKKLNKGAVVRAGIGAAIGGVAGSVVPVVGTAVGAAVGAAAAESPAAITKMLRETYGKEERIATARVQRLVKGGLGAVFGEAMLRPQTKMGRPRGPSGKYKIEGKPVFEEEYQQWAIKQKALNRITPSVAQETPVQEQVQAMAEQEAQMPQTKYAGTDNVQGPTGELPPEEMATQDMPQDMADEMPRTRTPITSEELKMAQELAQQQDNVLKAPNILKGELKATGGSLLTPNGPQIMDAPNAFKGQLRTLNRGTEVPAVRLGERPQTNPYGDEYIDIELGSGKPVLKKRPREKWVTGEAL